MDSAIHNIRTPGLTSRRRESDGKEAESDGAESGTGRLEPSPTEPKAALAAETRPVVPRSQTPRAVFQWQTRRMFAVGANPASRLLKCLIFRQKTKQFQRMDGFATRNESIQA